MAMTVLEVLVAPMAGAGKPAPSPNHPSLGGRPAAARTSPTTVPARRSSRPVAHVVATVRVVRTSPATTTTTVKPAARPAPQPPAAARPVPTTVRPAATTTTAAPATTTTTTVVLGALGSSSSTDDASFSDGEPTPGLGVASLKAAPAKPVYAATGLLARARVVPSGSLGGLRYHVVGRGETVVSIAKSYGLDPSVVRAANGVVADKLYVGARVMLEFPNPAYVRRSSATAPTTTVRPAPSTTVKQGPARTVSYKVVAGDTLSGIAKKTRTPLKTLLWLNSMTTTSKILPGKVLLALPSSSTPAPTTTVKPSPSPAAPATSGTWTANLPAMRCPVRSKFMNDWGFPRSGGRFHEGTDLFAPNGTPIVAPANGTLKYSMNSLGGLTFSLTTDSGWVVYGAHLSARTPLTGRVAAGTVIGYVGTSGDAVGTPPHLHLGLRPVSGRMTNAYPVMKAACG
jgi:murein DD-endopeptidase MepM/ murein hydrolase activator NlpD